MKKKRVESFNLLNENPIVVQTGIPGIPGTDENTSETLY